MSSAPDEQSGEVGGLQNTVTNLGASIATALAGAVLIAALTTTLLTGFADEPAIPDEITETATVELGSGVPFISDADLEAALDEAGVPSDVAAEIVEENTDARIAALRASLGVLAVIGLLALFASRNLPTVQPGAATAAGESSR